MTTGTRLIFSPHRLRLGLAIAFLCLSGARLASQSSADTASSSAKWTSSSQTDQLTGQVYTVFRLQGIFLQPPAHDAGDVPYILLRCDARPYRRMSGRLTAGFIVVGAVLDLKNGDVNTAKFRLDDGKLQNIDSPTYSTDYAAIAFDSIFLNNILWGHILEHKAGTGAPVHKLVIAVQEHLGGQIVMQFDMPAPDQPSLICGAQFK